MHANNPSIDDQFVESERRVEENMSERLQNEYQDITYVNKSSSFIGSGVS
jgi:hypothetical protein